MGYFVDFQELSIDKEVFGERHPEVAINLNNLGTAWNHLGEHEKAQQYMEDAYDIFLEYLGPTHQYTISTIALINENLS